MNKSREAFRTISEVSDWLETPAHVLRFWESKFSQIRPVKGAGGRRYYRPEDMALLGGIKFLLHEQGLTIKGAQKLLREQGVRYVASLGPQLFADDDAPAPVPVAAVIAPAFAPLQEDVTPAPAALSQIEAVTEEAWPTNESVDEAIDDWQSVAGQEETWQNLAASGEPEAEDLWPSQDDVAADSLPDIAMPDTAMAADALPESALPENALTDEALAGELLADDIQVDEPVAEPAHPASRDPAHIATAILAGHVHAAPGIGQRLAALAERAESLREHAATESGFISQATDAWQPDESAQPAVADGISADFPTEDSPVQALPLRRPLHQTLIHLMLSAPVQQAQDRETLAALRLRLHDARARISIE